MKKITLLILLFTITFNSYAQFTQGFETGVDNGWTTINNGGANGWVQNTAPSGGAQEGTSVASLTYNSTSHDDYLISPAISVSTGVNDLLSFFIKSRSSSYLEPYEVLLSTTNPSADQFSVYLQASEEAPASWTEKSFNLSEYDGQTVYVAIRATGTNEWELYVDNVINAGIPSCAAPTTFSLDDVTTTTATISWIAGGTETAWEYVVDAYGSDEPSTSGESTSNPLTVTDLTANTLYDVYVRADCGGGDFSNWAKISFATDCDLADEALSHDFDTVTNDLVTDASCWSVVNQGDANTWGLVQNSTTLNIYWRLTYSSTAHDDYLYSPAFTVLDGVTDAFNFKGWSSSSTYVESIDLLVVDATDNTVIATLESDLELPYVADAADATIFTYDLSAYEGQDVKIGFHSSTTDLLYAYLDEFTLDAFSTLGTATNILEGFTLYPTIVKEELNFRSQNKVEAITVFNLLGQKVFSGAPNTNNSSINLSNLRPGVYVVKVSAEGKTGSYKIVKE